MKFNVQRVLTPAYLTSVALVVLGVVFALAWYPVAAWLFVLLGLGLNATAVSVTEIHDSPRAPRTTARRRPSLPVRRPRAGQSAEDGHEDGPEEAGQDLDEERPAQPAAGGRPARSRAVEPEAETAATSVVPAAGSSALGARR
ncbi:hypothetical protein GCM10011374_05960 [Kocuria dechangensis]|uniref:Uncharacterized protein n=1 Tax=Kocuria dechangensis TaxID=1176249 RepID=A0A917GHY6_9MICC|nr:hypothetical protein [Kocuria dechangensis]GGG46426.1 hypothetical protein GCM10011374_05960 [Kocuria dechangensis]